MAQTPAGARLIMVDGTVEQSAKNGAHLTVLKFQRYVFDLDQFAGPARVTGRASSERYLDELFWPDPSLNPRIRSAYFAEAHNRLSQPLYCIAFALLALAAVTSGRRARGANALRMTIASVAAAGIRIAGYGVQGLAADSSALCVLFYLIPMLGAGAALIVLVGGLPKSAANESNPVPEVTA
jgi:lipopolysaccharide export system permease protein